MTLKKSMTLISCVAVTASCLSFATPFNYDLTTTYAEEILVLDNGIEYEIKADSTVAITHCPDDIDIVEIPSEIEGLPVTEIGAYAFCRNKVMTSVYIPDTVTTIQWEAFNECELLEKVTGAENVTHIEKNAFTNTPFLENNSEDMLIIGKCLYKYNGNEENVVIPDYIESICYKAFMDNTAIRSVVIPDSVSEIDSHTFAYCTSLSSIEIPEKITSIPWMTFAGCTSLEDVKINGNITYIGEYAFRDTPFLQNYPSDMVIIGNILYNYKGNAEIVEIPENVKSISPMAFKENSTLTEITIPENIEEIGSFAFSSCTSLKKAVVSGNVKNLGNGIFSGCNLLEEVILEDGLEYISDSMFSNCLSLTSITLPNTIKSIGYWSFSTSNYPDQIVLNDIYYKGTQEEWEKVSINDSFGITDGMQSVNVYFIENSTTEQVPPIETSTDNTTLSTGETTYYVTLKGDANSDNFTDIRDVTYINQYIIKNCDLNLQQVANADIIEDGTVDVKDLGQLKKYILGIVNAL